MKILQILIVAARLLLFTALVYGVYTETGKWTVISLVLLVIATKLNSLNRNDIRSNNPAFLWHC